MYEETGTFGQRAKRALLRAAVTLVILGLAGAVLYLLSYLNSKTFTLEARDGQLVVMQGRFLPLGADPYRPSDPGLMDTYAPISLEGPAPGSLLEESYSDRDALDRALFSYLEQVAQPRVASDDIPTLEKGLVYLRRAGRLSALTEEQRNRLKTMQAEVSFYQARSRLEDARKLLAESLTQLKLASESQTRHARAAHQMITEIEPSAKELEEALRRAVHTLSSPAPVEPPAPAAPQTVDAGT
ncbi:MAG: IF-2 protein [Myxococcaceae bacterium]